jgi:preprotein translocase subunit YajC
MPDEGAKDGDRFMGFADSFSARTQYSIARRERTRSREIRLNAAVQEGFREGVRILISNGTTGTIIKINRTRVKVKGDDGRMWSVPPRCMTLVKGR